MNAFENLHMHAFGNFSPQNEFIFVCLNLCLKGRIKGCIAAEQVKAPHRHCVRAADQVSATPL